MFSFGSIQSKKSKNIPHTYLFLLLSLFIASSGCSPETEIAGHKVCEGDIGKLIYIECPSGKSSADNSTTTGSGGGGIAGRIIMFDVGAINSSGEIFLIAKEAPDVTSPMVTKLVKYSASGSLDSTFGTNGELDVDSILPSANYYYPPVIDSSGNIYTAYNEFSSGNVYLFKFDSSGNLDSNFGTNGKLTLTGFSLSRLDVNASKIAVVGNINDEGYIAQLNSSDGSYDTGFDSDGILTFKVTDNQTDVDHVKYDSNGKLVVSGSIRVVPDSSNRQKDYYMGFIGRFESDGDLDSTTFDSSDDGFYTADNTTLSNPDNSTGVDLSGLALNSDDEIFAGICGNNFPLAHSATDTCEILKLDTSGSLDTTFDSDGKLPVGSSESIDSIHEFDVNSSDDLYFRGRTNNTYDFSGGGWGEIVSKVDGTGTYSSVKDDFDGTPYLFTGTVGSPVLAIDLKIENSGESEFIYHKLVD